MIGVLKKIWDFAGEEQGNIRKSMILGFFYAVFHIFQIAAIYVVVLALVGGSTDSAPAWQALGLLLASILGRAVLNRFSQLQQTHAGYFMVANKRISIGDKLKRVPMGYFNDQSLGELTGITTTVLDEVESTGPMVLVSILGGLINSAVMLLCVLFWDWRIGLLALAGMLVYLALLSGMEKQSAKIAPKRQRDEARLVEAVLEQLQGMSVIKSFNLTGKGDKRVRQALEDSRANNLAVEKLFTPYIWGQEMVLHLFSVLILAASVGLCLTGAMSLANALMAVIVSFLIFSQIQSAGSGVSALRLVGSSIDHANQVDGIPEMDQDGAALHYGGRMLRCVLTPGHTPGHLCLYDPARRRLFCGDHVLFHITPNICRWQGVEDSLGDYLSSLDRTAALDTAELYPAHRAETGDLRQRTAELKAHHARRLEDTLRTVEKAPGLTAYQIAGRMRWSIRCRNWADFPLAQKFFAVGEALAHLDHLEAQGRVFRQEIHGKRVYFAGVGDKI